MHELAAIQDILRKINEEAQAKGARGVLEVKIGLGNLRGLSLEHFWDDWKLLTKGTWLEKTKLEIELIPPRAHCRECKKDFSLDRFSLACPSCGAPEIEITSGKELLLDSLLIQTK